MKGSSKDKVRQGRGRDVYQDVVVTAVVGKEDHLFWLSEERADIGLISREMTRATTSL